MINNYLFKVYEVTYCVCQCLFYNMKTLPSTFEVVLLCSKVHHNKLIDLRTNKNNHIGKFYMILTEFHNLASSMKHSYRNNILSTISKPTWEIYKKVRHFYSSNFCINLNLLVKLFSLSVKFFSFLYKIARTILFCNIVLAI